MTSVPDDALHRALMAARGVGPETAARVRRALGLETVADLRRAADDGRLEAVAGVGPTRARAVRRTLDDGPPPDPDAPPPVAELLDVDREYRERAAAGDLPRIAPRRNNPEGEDWLPLLKTDRRHGVYTALFSNTDRAHDLGATDDWVVIYQDRPARGQQWTVVTARSGRLDGRRVVRGREAETRRHYADEADAGGAAGAARSQ